MLLVEAHTLKIATAVAPSRFAKRSHQAFLGFRYLQICSAQNRKIKGRNISLGGLLLESECLIPYRSQLEFTHYPARRVQHGRPLTSNGEGLAISDITITVLEMMTPTSKRAHRPCYKSGILIWANRGTVHRPTNQRTSMCASARASGSIS
jgi:hypothetical protein